jgi:hypothetical protein
MFIFYVTPKKAKAVPLHTRKALVGTERIASTHSLPRH